MNDLDFAIEYLADLILEDIIDTDLRSEVDFSE